MRQNFKSHPQVSTYASEVEGGPQTLPQTLLKKTSKILPVIFLRYESRNLKLLQHLNVTVDMKTNFIFESIWKSIGILQYIMEIVFLLLMIFHVYKNVQSSLNYDFICRCFFESRHIVLGNFKFSFVHLLDTTRTWNFKWNLLYWERETDSEF